MKIFGKRKRNDLSHDNEQKAKTGKTCIDLAPVKSYFGQQASLAQAGKDQRQTPSSNAQDKQCKKLNPKTEHESNSISIEQLLQMEHSRLNAKQRRQLKRHQERQIVEKKEILDVGAADGISSHVVNEFPTENGCSSSCLTVSTKEDIAVIKNSQDSSTIVNTKSTLDCVEITGKSDYEKTEIDSICLKSNKAIKDCLAETNNNTLAEILKMKPSEWNSKQRRLVKRYQERGGIVKVKKTGKDWSLLSKEERDRREKQRQMQKEAAERRKQLDEMDNTTNSIKRHPLNSERRRANKRKPGRSGKIAEAKREAKRRYTARDCK